MSNEKPDGALKVAPIYRCPFGGHPIFLYESGVIVPHYGPDGKRCAANGTKYSDHNAGYTAEKPGGTCECPMRKALLELQAERDQLRSENETLIIHNKTLKERGTPWKDTALQYLREKRTLEAERDQLLQAVKVSAASEKALYEECLKLRSALAEAQDARVELEKALAIARDSNVEQELAESRALLEEAKEALRPIVDTWKQRNPDYATARYPNFERATAVLAKLEGK